MEILIINQDEVAQLLPMADCIEAMAGALEALAREFGESAPPPRHFYGIRERRCVGCPCVGCGDQQRAQKNGSVRSVDWQAQ